MEVELQMPARYDSLKGSGSKFSKYTITNKIFSLGLDGDMPKIGKW
jgi:hypothetical protein